MTTGTQVGEIRLPRRPVAECLVGSQGVCRKQLTSTASALPSPMIALGLWAPHSGSDVPQGQLAIGRCHDKSRTCGGLARALALASAQPIIDPREVESFYLYVRSSFASYAADWLLDAADG